MTKSRSMGMRLLSLALCLVCMLCLIRPTEASEAEEKQTTLTTVVHNSARYSATVIGQMENGTAVTVLDETREFYLVDCYDMKGYIARSQILLKDDGKYYVNCQADSDETRTFTYEDHAQALVTRHSLYALARKQLGKPYIYGSTGMRGFDCSGLTYYLYGEHGTRLHRRASEQLQDGIIVSSDGMQVGDLVFFRESWDPCAASHVGIYVGNNQIIHASASHGIEVADLSTRYFAANFLCVRRVVHTQSAQLEEAEPMVTPRTVTPGRRAS